MNIKEKVEAINESLGLCLDVADRYRRQIKELQEICSHEVKRREEQFPVPSPFKTVVAVYCNICGALLSETRTR